MFQLKKKCFLLFLFFNGLSLSAQESQSEVASKWDNGEKNYYKNWGDNELNLVDKNNKANIKITKNSNGIVSEISFTGTDFDGYFYHQEKASTEFVRYYSDTYRAHCLFLTSGAMVIYNLKETNEGVVVKIEGCIGKKINQKDVNNLIGHLEATKKYWVPRSLTGLDASVKSVNVVPIYLDGNQILDFNEKFELGFEVEFNWGMKSLSRNLKGIIDLDNFDVKSNDLTLKHDRSTADGKYICLPDCRYIVNNEMKIEGIVKGTSLKFSKSVPVNCDLDISPGIVEARKWSQYSQILFEYTEKGETKEKDFANENGFLKYADWFLWLIKNYKDDQTFLVRVTKNSKCGYADVNSKLVIPCEYEGGSPGNSMTDKIIGVKKGGKWGYIDLQNKVIVQFKYDKIRDFYNGMGKVYLGEKAGFVNARGVEVVKPIYDKAWSFKNGAAVVMKDGKYGFVNENGAVLGGIIYDDAFDFDSNKFGFVKNGKNYGVIDLSGKLIVPIEQEIKPVSLNADLISISKNSLFGVINRSGKMIVDFKYEAIYPVGTTVFGDKVKKESEKVFRVKQDGKYGFLKTDGTVLSECIYFDAGDFFDGLAKVETYEDGITKKGNFLLQSKHIDWYEEIDHNVKESDNANNSNKGNNSKAKSVSDKKTIKNTGKNPLYYKAGSSTSSMNGGSSNTFPCSQAIYYCNKDAGGHHVVKGALISGANEDCGKTVTAVGGN